MLFRGRWNWCSLSSGLQGLAWAAPRGALGCRRAARTVHRGAPEALSGHFFSVWKPRGRLVGGPLRHFQVLKSSCKKFVVSRT